MNLDRGLIKQQAKTLIKGKVMKLFVVSFIVSICISLIASVSAGISAVAGSYSVINQNNHYTEDFDHFDSFNEDAFDSADAFNNFRGNIQPVDYVIGEENHGGMVAASFASFLSMIGSVASILLAPLAISLAAYYVEFIRGKDRDLDDGIKSVFKNTFNKTYAPKLGLFALKSLFTYLWSLLFFIPGIVFSYSSRFAFQIMCDNPNIKPMQAIKLSKKIVQGNRTELFVLDLSFIPWMLLSIFIFPLIYIIPYYHTTDALYYENFRIRALQQGRVTEDDFLTDEEKMIKYAQQGYTQNQNGNQYYNPNVNVGSQNAYYNPNQENAQQNVNNAGNVEFTQTSYNASSVQFNQNADNTTTNQQNVVNETESKAQYQPPVEKAEDDNATIIIDGVPLDNDSKDTTNEL